MVKLTWNLRLYRPQPQNPPEIWDYWHVLPHPTYSSHFTPLPGGLVGDCCHVQGFFLHCITLVHICLGVQGPVNLLQYFHLNFLAEFSITYPELCIYSLSEDV